MKNYDYNDDFANVIDQCISSPRVCEAYCSGEKNEWIIKIDDEFIRDGIKHLNEMQISIIEALLFEGKCIQDICNKYCLTHNEVFEQIRSMKITIAKYM